MNNFWNGFEKRSSAIRILKNVSRVVGRHSKGGSIPKAVEMPKHGSDHKAPPIPGPKPHTGSSSAIPGQGALIPGVTPGIMKSAPSSRGVMRGGE